MNKSDEAYFESQFLKSFQLLGEQNNNKYAKIINDYTQIVIPFEKRRMAENQTLVIENSTLEKDKIQMIGQIQKIKSENQRLQYTLQKQTDKINDLQRKLDDSQKLNMDHINLIQSLRLSNEDLKEALQQKIAYLKQIQKDKQSLNQKFEAKTNDYNILLANYMKDKNIMADKLNQMNQIEQSLVQRQKKLKQDLFYLKKQWEEFQDARKKETPQPKKQSRIFGKYKAEQKQYQKPKIEQQVKKQKNINCQILKNATKKIYKHHTNQIYDLTFNYNGNLLATCGGDRQVKMYDVVNLRNICSINSNSAESIYISIALNYGGERLLAGSTDKTVSIFHSQSGKLLHTFLGHGDRVNSVAWTSSKQKCISGSQDKQLKVWQIEKACNLMSVGCGRSIKVVSSNNVEPVAYTGHADGSVRIYSINQGNQPVSQVKGLIDYPITSISILSNRNQVLVSSTQGSCLHLIDLKMNKSITKYDHKDFFNTSAHADISPSQNLVLSGNCDGNIYYWDRHKNDFIKKISGHDAAITALKYHFMTSVLASTDKEGSLILWQ